MIMSSRFAKYAEAEARLISGLEESSINGSESVLTLEFHAPYICVMDVACIPAAEEAMKKMVDFRLKIQSAIKSLIEMVGPSVSIQKINADWKSANNYDPICNPEMLLPRWIVTLTIHYA